VRVHVAEAGHDVQTAGVDDARPLDISVPGRTERADHAALDDQRVVGELALGVERQRGDVRQRERLRLAPGKFERQELR